jgi:hypothetical protein
MPPLLLVLLEELPAPPLDCPPLPMPPLLFVLVLLPAPVLVP